MESALRGFLETPAGRDVRVNLLGMGSVEGAMEVLDGPGPSPHSREPIHV